MCLCDALQAVLSHCNLWTHRMTCLMLELFSGRQGTLQAYVSIKEHDFSDNSDSKEYCNGYCQCADNIEDYPCCFLLHFHVLPCSHLSLSLQLAHGSCNDATLLCSQVKQDTEHSFACSTISQSSINSFPHLGHFIVFIPLFYYRSQLLQNCYRFISSPYPQRRPLWQGQKICRL